MRKKKNIKLYFYIITLLYNFIYLFIYLNRVDISKS